MKIRAVVSLLAVAVAVTLSACSGSVTTPDAARPGARSALDSVPPSTDTSTPPDTTHRNGGGLLGSGN